MWPTDDVPKILKTEMRVILDGLDGWARGWISNEHEAPPRLMPSRLRRALGWQRLLKMIKLEYFDLKEE